MSISIDKDVVVSVHGQEPGSETHNSLELREGWEEGTVRVHAPTYGSEVEIADLRAALDEIEKVAAL